MEFEWDIEKGKSTFKKHKVEFSEAETVFGDPLARVQVDERHSIGEKREILIGHSIKNRLLVVSYTEKESDTVRVISARQATLAERKDYEQAR